MFVVRLLVTVMIFILGLALNVNVLDSRRPFIPFEEFYNETLSEAIEMDNDFSCYRCKFKVEIYLYMIES